MSEYKAGDVPSAREELRRAVNPGPYTPYANPYTPYPKPHAPYPKP